MKKIALVLPSNTPAAINYSISLRMAGDAEVIGASSLPVDHSAGHYDQYIKIPWITDTRFDESILDLVTSKNPDLIYCPQNAIYDRLVRLLPASGFRGTLVALNDIDTDSAIHQSVANRASNGMPFIHHRGKATLSESFVSAVMEHFLRIPGQCSEDKFCALLAASLDMPAGDIIEIGSFYGKSAFVLGLMAKRQGTGKMLCIDPWYPTASPQKEVHEVLRNVNVRRDRSLERSRFVSHLLPYLDGEMNYLHMTSAEGHQQYSASRDVSSPEFGSVHYSGKVAYLHIDGNHDAPFVQEDIDLWGPHLVAGAWIIFDDYYWCYGDGPRVVADAWLEGQRERVESAFACGGALFVKLR